MDLILATLNTEQQIWFMVLIGVIAVAFLFFLYLVLYYLFVGIKSLFEPMIKANKWNFEISPTLGAILTSLFVLVILAILVLTNLAPILDVINRIFGD